jgi:hypothetical protein
VTLQRLYSFFVLEVGSRYVHILGVTTNPDEPWTVRRIRRLLKDLGDGAADFRFLRGNRVLSAWRPQSRSSPGQHKCIFWVLSQDIHLSPAASDSPIAALSSSAGYFTRSYA